MQGTDRELETRAKQLTDELWKIRSELVRREAERRVANLTPEERRKQFYVVREGRGAAIVASLALLWKKKPEVATVAAMGALVGVLVIAPWEPPPVENGEVWADRPSVVPDFPPPAPPPEVPPPVEVKIIPPSDEAEQRDSDDATQQRNDAAESTASTPTATATPRGDQSSPPSGPEPSDREEPSSPDPEPEEPPPGADRDALVEVCAEASVLVVDLDTCARVLSN